VKDLGTLGGSFSLAYGIDDKGQISGFSTLSGDQVVHAFVIQGSRMIDMGTLGGPNSQAFSNLNNLGRVIASAEANESDPNGEDFCGFGTHDICLGMLWHEGASIPLETLGGNNSQATAINKVGQIAGIAETSEVDAGCPPQQAPFSYQVLYYKPVIWDQGGHATVLPLYDRDAEGGAFWINNGGDAVGASGVCSAFDGRYGLPLAPEHALLWRQGQVILLPGLGGGFNNSAFAINDVGQIVGASDLPGDQSPADLHSQHAVLWENGASHDLGTLPGDTVSAAIGINNLGQITGVSEDNSGNRHAFLWQNGVMMDMNDLIPPPPPHSPPPLYLLHGFGINNLGQVVGFALLPSGEVHGFVATPVSTGK
jgi:probable HAF family extracellular repeat protein